MLYTGNGDDGTTKIFGCDQKLSKSSAIAEALGALDEINSLLGWCKVKATESGVKIVLSWGDEKQESTFSKILANLQQGLFVAQAEVAGADKHIEQNKVEFLEAVVNSIEKHLPPITSFLVSGGTELSSLLDFARTVARRAERRVVEVKEEGVVKVSEELLAYMNRLSSVLYALARLANAQAGIEEEKPEY